MHTGTVLLRLSLVLLVLAALPGIAFAGDKDGSYTTAFTKWTGDGLSGFMGTGVVFDSTQLVLDPNTAETETDPNPTLPMYNGGTYKVGEAAGPVFTVPFAFTEAIPSWNATTPDGTWIEIQMRAFFGDTATEETATKWYNLGVWASGTSTIKRHSVRLQGDSNGYVATDTLVLTAKKVSARAFQLKVRLFSANGALPTVKRLGVTYNSAPAKKVGPTSATTISEKVLLDVPECSQMVYPNGGNVWCSPTSTSMVLGYWGYMPGECEPRVKDAVAGTMDFVYNGNGNWPFNTAYAASRADFPMEAYVVRYTGLDKLEPWVQAGVPVVVSFAWKKGELTDAAVSSSSGHLSVIVGFDAQGNPIVNDPAASKNEDVQRTYLRSEFEQLWLANSGGTVYLIFPPGKGIAAF